MVRIYLILNGDASLFCVIWFNDDVSLSYYNDVFDLMMRLIWFNDAFDLMMRLI